MALTQVSLQRIGYILQNATPSVSFQSKRLRRSVEPRRGAGRRNLGTRVWHNRRAPIANKSGAKPRHVKNLHLPPEPKTSPGSTRPKQSETNLRSAWAGALGGSSGWVREVWRVGRPLRKGSPCASKVFRSFFLTPRKLQPTSGTRRGRNGGQDQDRVTLREPSHRSPICRRGDTCCCGEASSAPERRT